jgi:hypothetical protein
LKKSSIVDFIISMGSDALGDFKRLKVAVKYGDATVENMKRWSGKFACSSFHGEMEYTKYVISPRGIACIMHIII